MTFDWDPNKEAANRQNHNVSFGEAALVFEDFYALEEYDDAHSAVSEKSYTIVGLAENRILYVVYTMRGADEAVCRIISAREAENDEREIYEELRIRDSFYE